ncbi:MAG TPA: histidinol-phosphate transaminase [Victivallales bacterium]|nr:histidinol-phosphate transaminase [Victivallales bacterium]
MALLDYLNKDVDKIIPYNTGKRINEVARELGLNPESFVKLASNECPLGPSPKAVEAIKKFASNVHRYPDGSAYLLKNKLAEHLSVTPDQLIIGTGSNEIIEFIGHCFINENNSIVMSKHAFAIYKILSIMFGAEYVEVPMNGFTHDLEAILDNIKNNTRVIFICNPNNPTSTIVREKEIDNFIARVPDDILIVFDEAYKEITQEQLPDTIKYVRNGKNVIVLRSFSKSYGLAGLRIGYGISTPEIIHSLNKSRQPFNVNLLAQMAALHALDDQEFVAKSKEVYRKGIELITKACDDMNIEYEPPYANFILIKVCGNEQEIYTKLLNKGVIVRPLKGYLLPGYIRVSIGTENENKKFIKALKEVLNIYK